MKVIILNDTTRSETHLGCLKVMQNIAHACENNKLQIISSFKSTTCYKDETFYSSLIETDAIILNGEGTFHDDQAEAIDLLIAATIAKLEYNKPVFLINSVWQNNYFLKRYLYIFDKIFVRESLSLAALEKDGGKGLVVPDMTFYNFKPLIANKRRDILVTDSVLSSATNKLYKYSLRHLSPFATMRDKLILKVRWPFKILSKLNLFPYIKLQSETTIAESKLIITGRFHVMCIAMMYEVPFWIVPSNTHKVEGTLKDAHVDPQNCLLSQWEMGIHQTNPGLTQKDMENMKEYIANATMKIDDMFKEIKSFIEASKELSH